MSSCNDIQEKIARDESLNEAERAHTIACQSCASVIADFSLLEAALSEIGAASRRVRRSCDGRRGRRGHARHAHAETVDTLTLAYAAGVLAVVNVAGFLASVFAASVALGGTP